MENKTSRAWIEIDTSALLHNVKCVQNILPNACTFMAVVKADAYGHGAIEVATFLQEQGVTSFAVATLEEGIALRKAKITSEILILGYTHPSRIQEVITYDLMQTIISYEYARQIHTNKVLKVHLKIDTGMHRLGCDEQDIETIKELCLEPSFSVKGIYTHLCVSDSLLVEDIAFTKRQIQHFNTIVTYLHTQQIEDFKVHVQSSYGVLNYPEHVYDYARIGIAMYGLYSTDTMTKMNLPLQPVLSIKARVAMVKTVKAGEYIGYGRGYLATKAMRVATIPIGYADGLPRNLQATSFSVLIKGQKAPMIGRMSMDQITVDVSTMTSLQEGDIVTIVGKENNQEITILEIAKTTNTITNEIVSRLGSRLPKVYK